MITLISFNVRSKRCNQNDVIRYDGDIINMKLNKEEVITFDLNKFLLKIRKKAFKRSYQPYFALVSIAE